MKKMGSRGRAWLKGVHIFFACAWVGAAVCMMLLHFVKSNPANGDELYAFNVSIKLLDDFVVIPAAFGSLITGLLFSWLTDWGFFKFNWMTVKWIVTVGSIIFGTFWLGPWVNGATAISDAERLLSLQNPVYLYFKQMNSYFGSMQTLILIALAFISVLKPWGKRR